MKRGSKKFFEVMDKGRYTTHSYILNLINQINQIKGENKKVLEVGCGIGSDLVRFAKKGGKVTGIDISPRSIKLAKENFKVAGVKGNLKVADAENLPFKDGSFDLVYSMGVLHHIPNTQEGIEEIYRVLLPGGKAIVMLYHKNFFTYWIKLFFIRGVIQGQFLRKSFEKIKNDLEYKGCPLVKLFTIKEAKCMFLRTGFKDVRTELFFIHQKNVPLIGRLIPQSVLDILAKRFGFHLVIYARKPL